MTEAETQASSDARQHGTPALARLEARLGKATPVPFTEQVLINRNRLLGLVEEVQAAALASGQAGDRIEELASLIEGARAVPLTGFHRVDRPHAIRLIAEIREALRG